MSEAPQQSESSNSRQPVDLIFREQVVSEQYQKTLNEVFKTQEYLDWYNSLGFSAKLKHNLEMKVPLLSADILAYYPIIINKLKSIYYHNPDFFEFLQKKEAAFDYLREEYYPGTDQATTLPIPDPKIIETIEKRFDFYLKKK